jgi:hypothetical protein
MEKQINESRLIFLLFGKGNIPQKFSISKENEGLVDNEVL